MRAKGDDANIFSDFHQELVAPRRRPRKSRDFSCFERERQTAPRCLKARAAARPIHFDLDRDSMVQLGILGAATLDARKAGSSVPMRWLALRNCPRNCPAGLFGVC